MTSDTRNLIAAVVLSVLVFLGWGLVQQRFFPTAANPPPTEVAGGRTTVLPNPAAQSTTPVAAAPAVVRERAQVLAEAPRVAIRTPVMTGSINLAGARVDDLILTNYHETIDAKSPNIRLFTPAGTKGAAYAAFGFSGAGAPGEDARWTADGPVLAPGRPVTLRFAGVGGAEYRIALTVADNYLIRAEQSVVNRGAAAVSAVPYALVTRTGESPDASSFTAFFGPTAIVDGKITHTKWKEVREAPERTQRFAGAGWLGFSEKYWLAALAPAPGERMDASFRHAAAGDRYQADIATAALVAGPGQAVSRASFLFAGAKEVQLLQRIETRFGIKQFDNAIDWGWFRIIAKPIFSLLDFLFGLFGNFGLAIIGLVLILKLLLFPIASKQYRSMAKLRLLAPKLKALQDRHKDDKERQAKEMMEFYKREGANPVGGCLPTLVQIPIFFALYKTLLVTIEMRHQPLALWIKDLSAPDPLTPLNLFGLLPFTPPHVIAIGVLPLLLGVTMWYQQKQNPPSADPAQQQIFQFMPWIFMFVMAPFAAGLQLYWATNNTLTILQQAWLKRDEPKAA